MDGLLVGAGHQPAYRNATEMCDALASRNVCNAIRTCDGHVHAFIYCIP